MLVATIFLYTLLLKPAYEEVNQLRGDLAVKSDLVKTQTKVVMEVQELLAQYQSLTAPKQIVALSLPNQEGYPTLLNQINSLARAAGLALESVNLNLLPYAEGGSSGSNLPVIGAVQLTMSLSGPYQSLKNFLETIENNIRIMDLASLDITPQIRGDNFSYNVVVNAYYQSL